MDETEETLNSMINNSNNPAATLDAAIEKVLDHHAPLKKCLELKDWPKNLG